jgi:hypothetical protein
MGKSRGPYNPEFPKGTRVRIAGSADLEEFAKKWKNHDPLQEDQLKFHDIETIVEDVFFYHGGDELYKSKSVPGVWHEQCLKEVHDTAQP